MFDRELNCLTGDGAGSLPVYGWRPDGVEAGLAGLEPSQLAFLKAAGFNGSAGQTMLVPGGPAGIAAAVLGLGADRSPHGHAGLPMALPEATTWQLVPGDYDTDDAILGWCLGAYQFAEFRKPARAPATLALTAPHPPGSTRALAMARATWLARDLINMPANLLGPAELADVVGLLGKRFGAAVETIQGDALTERYPTIAAVGAGSDRGAVVALLRWTGTGADDRSPLLSLCGKGVVFDSGGYDLKPSAFMLRMKKDMGGAALMVALASVVMAADLPLRMEVRIGCVENMVSGRAMRPMDVLRTRKGLTVEIGNTDAEGRLVLCDLLDEACESAPALLVDAATLTGAARVALGPDLPALFCNDDAVAETVLAAGVARHDPLWRLPLHPGYESMLSSAVADLNNVSGKPLAGAIVAGLFLQRFVTTQISWVHIDTYAWNDQTRAGRPEGGESMGLRAMFATIEGSNSLNPKTMASTHAR